MKIFLIKLKFKRAISGIPNPEYRKKLMKKVRLLDNRKYMYRFEFNDKDRLYLLRAQGSNGYMFAVVRNKSFCFSIVADANSMARFFFQLDKPRLELKQRYHSRRCHECTWGNPVICDCLIK